MRIKEIILQNVFQHKYLVWRPVIGLNGVIGPNGSGKSNIISAVYSAITGDFKRHSAGKAGYLRIGTPDGEDSFVEVTFELGGHDYTVRRFITSNRAFFKMDGLSVSSKISEVNQSIEEILGGSDYLLDKHIFVRQVDFLSFIASPADRAKQISQICRTDFMEILWTNLGVEINTVKDIIHNLDLELQTVNAKKDMLFKLEQDLYQLECDYNKHSEACPNTDDVEKARLLLKAAQEQQALQKELNTLSQQSAQLAVKIEDIRKDIVAIEQQLAEFDAKYGTHDDINKEINNLLSKASKLPEIVKHNVAVRNYRDIMSRTFKYEKPQEPEPPYEGITFANAQEHIDKYVAQKYHYENILQCRDKEVCPVCGTPVQNFEWKIEEAEANLPILNERIKKIGTYQSHYQQYLRELERYQTLLNEFNQIRTEAEIKLKELGDEIPEDEYRKAANKIESLRKLLDYRSKLIENKRSKLVLLQTYHETFENTNHRIDTIKQNLISITPQQIKDAQELIQRFDSWKEKSLQLQAVIDNLKNQISNLKDEISRLVENNEYAKIRDRYESWLKIVTRAREIFHRSALPAIIHQQVLHYLASLMNKFLLLLDAGFSVTVDDELNIIANFGDERTSISCHDLSGGQKVMLAIVYRLAIQEAFSNIDCLVLDEPTNFLDEYHLEKFSQLLDQLRTFCQKHRKQLYVITHERSIERCFDSVLVLDDLNESL